MHYYAAPGIKNNIFIPANMTEEIRLQYANQIIESVARYYNVSMERVKGKSREGDLPKVRQISSFYIKKKIPMMRLKEIAGLYGQRYLLKSGFDADHSAIVHNVKTVEGWLKVHDPLEEDVLTIKNLI